MKRHYFLFTLIPVLFALAACETHRQAAEEPVAAPALKQDFLTTGRGLSNGAVDLYQPGTDFLPTAQFPTAGRSTVSPIPGNPNVVNSDPSVTIYSLDTMNISEPKPAPLPPLQPPSVAKGNYMSPFDDKVNSR